MPGEYARQFPGAEDCRPRCVVAVSGEVLWSSPTAQTRLIRPLPVRLEGGRLKLVAENSQQGAADFLASIGERPSQHFLRSNRKEDWVLLKAWRLPGFVDTIAIICNLSIPCRGVVESGMVAEFGLTAGEARVLELLAHVRPPRDIAAELGVSIDTVRSHIKRIFSKTSVESTAQLLQLTYAYCAS